jgi:LacI family transcriptional regulator
MKGEKKSERNGGNGVRRQAVTIHDVARHAGVSSMTASRVVNRQHYVSEEMRDRVMASVRALGYKPNLAARAARSGTLQIGLLYSNPNSSNLSAFLMGAFLEAGKLGCQLLVEPTATHSSNQAAVKKLIEHGADAVVLPPPLCDDEEILKLLRRKAVTAVSFTTARPRSDTSAVLIDDYKGAVMMTERLIALGHRDIAFIRGDMKHSTAVRREEGFRAAMEDAGIPVNPAWVAEGQFTYRGGLEAARQLLEAKPRPTAIFASNDDMATAVLAVAHGLGIAVPDELSVAGFDDTPVATTVWPELTTIHQPIADMAAQAVLLALDGLRRKRAGETVPVVHHHADLELIERASTAEAPNAGKKKPSRR